MPQPYLELGAVAVTTTGSAGSAAGNDDTSEIVNGNLWGVYIDYNTSAPATTKLIIKDGKGRVLWTGTANNGGIGNTDGWIYPLVGAFTNQLIPLAGLKINFDLTLSDALDPAATFYPIVLL